MLGKQDGSPTEELGREFYEGTVKDEPTLNTFLDEATELQGGQRHGSIYSLGV